MRARRRRDIRYGQFIDLNLTMPLFLLGCHISNCWRRQLLANIVG